MKHVLILGLAFIMTMTQAQMTFSDMSNEANIDHGNRNSGVAVADYDGDGWQDVYVSVRDGANRLYRNQGDGSFMDVAPDLGLDYSQDTRTSGWGDINNDGYPDLYLGNNYEADLLFINNGDGTFSDMTMAYGIDNIQRPYSILFSDINNDGWLDLYIANFQDQNKCYLNNGSGGFSDFTIPSGALDIQNNMGAVFFDYDKDGDQDLYLCHDGQANILYENDGNGYFTDKSIASGLNFDGFGMGVDVGDINRDGHLDIYITNLFENALFLNNGNKTFTNIAASAGVDDYGMGWGTNFFDFDNDGWVDIHVANDSYFSDYNNIVYRNKGDNTFEKVLLSNPISSDKAAYGSACFDFDRNGLLDVFVANAGVSQDDRNQLFRNDSEPKHFVGFKFKGVSSNAQAIGTKIEMVDEQGKRYYDEVTSGSGYASQNPGIHHFGLASAENIHSLIITWPSGLIQSLSNLPADHYYEISEGDDPVILYENSRINNKKSDFDIRLYPNPAREELFIDVDENDDVYKLG